MHLKWVHIGQYQRMQKSREMGELSQENILIKSWKSNYAIIELAKAKFKIIIMMYHIDKCANKK